MTKPNFNKMTRKEVLAYCKEHRTDDEAWDVFFDKLEQQRSPDTKWYPAPLDEESIKIMEEAFRQKIQESTGNSSPL